MTPPFEREREFVLGCCFDAAPPTPPTTLAWDWVFRESVRQGVGPLVREALRRSGPVPPKVAKAFDDHHYAVIAKNLSHLDEAAAAIAGLRAAGVRAVPLKGVALAERVYRNIALRPFEDVDLLVRRGDLRAAVSILAGRGYAAPGYQLPESWYLINHFHLPLVRERPKRVYLELHWDFTDRFLLHTTDLAEVWAAAGEFLHPEDELIYLAMHLAKHAVFNDILAGAESGEVRAAVFDPLNGNRLMWFVDLRRLIDARRADIDWGRVAAKASRWRALGTLDAALRILGALDPGSGELPRLMPVAPRAARGSLRQYLFEGGAPRLTRLLMTLNGRAQFRPIRILGVARYFFPPLDFLAKRYRVRPLAAALLWPVHLARAAAWDPLASLAVLAQFFVLQAARRPRPFP